VSGAAILLGFALLGGAGAASLLLFRRWRGGGWVKVAAGNLVLSLLLLGAVFLAGETWFALDWDTTDGSFALLSSQRWIRRHVRLNARGFRDRRELDGATIPGERRILVLGDSLAFGQGINRAEDRFSDLLETMLGERGVPARVHNVAQPGWNTQEELQELWRLSREGIPFDLVVLAYCLNDHFYFPEQPEPYRRAVDRAAVPPAAARLFTQRSYLLSFLYHRLTTFRDPVLAGYPGMVLDFFRRPDIRARHSRELLMLRDHCRGVGADLVVVTFPLTFGTWEDYPLEEMHRALGEFWRGAGVEHVDLREDFRTQAVERLTVGRYDRHPNERANRIAAERVLPLLLGRLGRR
jgi:hypothetical protein